MFLLPVGPYVANGEKHKFFDSDIAPSGAITFLPALKTSLRYYAKRLIMDCGPTCHVMKRFYVAMAKDRATSHSEIAPTIDPP